MPPHCGALTTPAGPALRCGELPAPLRALSLAPWGEAAAATGAVVCAAFDPAGGALVASWAARGPAAWTVDGARLLAALPPAVDGGSAAELGYSSVRQLAWSAAAPRAAPVPQQQPDPRTPFASRAPARGG